MVADYAYNLSFSLSTNVREFKYNLRSFNRSRLKEKLITYDGDDDGDGGGDDDDSYAEI